MSSLPLLDYLENRRLFARSAFARAPRRLRDAASLIVLAAGSQVADVVEYSNQHADIASSYGIFSTWERLIIAPFLMNAPTFSANALKDLAGLREHWASFGLRVTEPWQELSLIAILSAGYRADDSYLLSRISAALRDLKTSHFWETSAEIMPILALLAAYKSDTLIDLDLVVSGADISDLPRRKRLEAVLIGTLSPESMADHCRRISAHREALLHEKLQYAADNLPLLSFAALREPDPLDLKEDVTRAYDALRLNGGAPAMSQTIAVSMAILLRCDPLQTKMAAVIMTKSLIEDWRQQQAATTALLVPGR